MPKVFTSKTQTIGKLGEDIACRYLENQGFKILEKNHTRKWGEIDIVAEKNKKIFFVEVKSKSVLGLAKKSQEDLDKMNPEENVHQSKIERFMRTIETYLAEKQFEGDWEAFVLAVFLDQIEKTAKIRKVSLFD